MIIWRGGSWRARMVWVSVAMLTVAWSVGDAAESGDDLGAVETAFAATMADRDLAAFESFLDDEVVFFSGPVELRGRTAVVDAWSGYFDDAEAPFSWRPEVVSVLDSGHLGLTSGPVFDAEGNRVATFNSIWRKNQDGVWKIVFDRGCP